MSRSQAQRASLVADAGQAAIDRVARRADEADPASFFADVGEALYWISALADVTYTKGNALPDLLSGIIWARDMLTHGDAIWELHGGPGRSARDQRGGA
jgi:hypothetical protein